jgi:hypothetical protein
MHNECQTKRKRGKMKNASRLLSVLLIILMGVAMMSCSPKDPPAVVAGHYYAVIQGAGISYKLTEEGKAIISIQQTYHAEGTWTRDGDNVLISHSNQTGRPLYIFQGSTRKAVAYGDSLLVYDNNGTGHSFLKVAD